MILYAASAVELHGSNWDQGEVLAEVDGLDAAEMGAWIAAGLPTWTKKIADGIHRPALEVNITSLNYGA